MLLPPKLTAPDAVTDFANFTPAIRSNGQFVSKFTVNQAHPTFSDRIADVVRRGPLKKMFWPDALRRIAGMQDIVDGPRTVRQKPRNPVGWPCLPLECYGPVALLAVRANPEPAIIRFVDVKPEPFHNVRNCNTRCMKCGTKFKAPEEIITKPKET